MPVIVIETVSVMMMMLLIGIGFVHVRNGSTELSDRGA
jgi:hypothetical protein